MGTGVFGAFDAGARGTLPDFFCGTLEAGRFLSAIGFRRTLFAFRPSLGARMIDIQANFSIVVVLGACIAPLGPSKCILLYANSRAETNSEQRKANSGCYANSPPSPCRLRNSFGGRAGVSWFAGDPAGSGFGATVVCASRSSSDSS